MTWRLWPLCFCFLFSALCFRALGQYSLDWSTVDGGGGTSTGGVYSVSGTIGQPDASSVMSGGQYSVTGGFWSLIAAVQTPGAPLLTITHSGNSVIVSWPVSPGGFSLQQNGNVANASGWSTYGGTVNTNNGVNSITVTPPLGSLFFRLSNPLRYPGRREPQMNADKDCWWSYSGLQRIRSRSASLCSPAPFSMSQMPCRGCGQGSKRLRNSGRKRTFNSSLRTRSNSHSIYRSMR